MNPQTLATLLWIDSLSSFSRWDWAEIIAAILVAIGCVGEMCWLFRKWPRKEEWLTHEEFEKIKSSREKLFAIVVAVGVVVEMITLPHGLKEAAALGIQVQQLTRSNLSLSMDVLQIPQSDPINLPPISLRAEAYLYMMPMDAAIGTEPEVKCDAEVAFGQGVGGLLSLRAERGLGPGGTRWYSFQLLPMAGRVFKQLPTDKTAKEWCDSLDKATMHFNNFGDLTNRFECSNGLIFLSLNGRQVKRFALGPGEIVNGYGDMISTNSIALYAH
jgi:hypothetical protein